MCTDVCSDDENDDHWWDNKIVVVVVSHNIIILKSERDNEKRFLNGVSVGVCLCVQNSNSE